MAGELHNWDPDSYWDCRPSRRGMIGSQRTTTQFAIIYNLTVVFQG